MPTYGLTTEGFLAKTLDIVRNDINTAIKNAFGATVRTDDQSILGQLVGILAERLALLWEILEIIYGMMDPDSATGAALERLALLTGTLRPQATFSAVNLVLTGDPATTVPSGNQVKTSSTGATFLTDNSVVLAAVPAWATSHAYAIGNRVTANGHVYQCVVAGTSDPTTGPNSFPPNFLDPGNTPHAQNDIHDGTVTWVYCGEGTAAGDTTATATTSGIVPAAAYDLSVIVNSILGWSSVTNLEDAVVGREIATDAELRLLREQELAAGGSSPINALRAELLQVPGTIAVSIFENVTDFTDADGLPPHSIEAIVRGPSPTSAAYDQSIFDALLAGVAAGIKTASATLATTVVGTAVDDQGTSHTMTFSRPTEVPIAIILDVVKDPDEYPADGDAQIKAAIVAWGDAQSTGRDAVASRIIAQAFQVPGVLDVTSCKIAVSPAVPTVSTTIAITPRQLATYDTSHIVVNSSNGIP